MNSGAEVIQLPHKNIRDAAYSHDGQFLATVGQDNTSRLWDTADNEEFAQFKNSETLQHVAIASGATEIISWNRNKAEVYRSPGKPESTKL